MMRILAIGILLAALAPGASAGELATYFPAGAAESLRIDLDFGEVDLVPHDAPEIRIVAEARGLGASSVHFAAHVVGDTIVVTGDAEPWVELLQGLPSVRVRAWVPRHIDVEVRRRPAPATRAAVPSSFRPLPRR